MMRAGVNQYTDEESAAENLADLLGVLREARQCNEPQDVIDYMMADVQAARENLAEIQAKGNAHAR